MAKRRSVRVDTTHLSQVQKCYREHDDTFPADLFRVFVTGGMCVIDGVGVNRALRRRIKAQERGKR